MASAVRIVASAIAIALSAYSAHAAGDSTWVEHYRAAFAAHAAGDYAGFRSQLLSASRSLGDTPGINYNLACAAARLGDRAEALRRLEWFAASGLVRDAATDSDFVALWRDPAFVRAIHEDLVRETPAAVQRVTAFLGLAFDERLLRYHEEDLRLGDVAGHPRLHGVWEPVYQSSVGRWRTTFDAREIAELDRLLGPTLAALGYGAEALSA